MNGSPWTLHIEGLGKLNKADIQLAPLTIIVGKNNSGKSYLSSLLWAMSNPESTIFRGERPSSKSYQNCVKWIKDASKLSRDEVCLFDDSVLNIFLDFINSYLKENTKRIIDDIFSCDMPVAGRMAISNLSSGAIKGVEVFFEKEQLNREDIIGSISQKIRRMGEDNFRHISFSPSMEMLKAIYADRICFYMYESIDEEAEWEIVKSICCYLLGSSAPRDFAYIPAARTGLMLSYDALVSSLFETMGRQADGSSQANLPLPTIRFLQTISRMREDKNSPTYKVGEYIEKNVMQGAVKKDEKSKNKFVFSVEDSQLTLPMHVTSSLVTELAPFAMHLKSGWFGTGIFFEEPEAHLHIEAQRTIARCIARIVNLGVKMVITTHGDLFLQEINNLMHMYAHPRKKEIMKKFGYKQHDLINPSMARCYWLCEEDGKSKCVELDKKPEGFSNPEMNKVIGESTKITWELQS